MTQLGRDARAILDAAKGGDDPSDTDRRRVHSSLVRRIGVGAAIVGTTATTTAAAGGATMVAGASSLAKLALAVVALVGAVGGGAYVVHRVTSKPTPARIATTIATTVVVSTAVPTSTLPTLPDPTPPPVSTAVNEPTPAPSESATTPKPPPPQTTQTTQTAQTAEKKGTFDAELALMQKAQAALGAGDAQGALVFLAEHAKNFPSGALSEERQGMRVLALCALGRSDARAAAESFLGAHPQSPLATRIRSSCDLAE